MAHKTMSKQTRAKLNQIRNVRKVMKIARKEGITQYSGLARFGFRSENGGTHSARTMMVEDLQLLLSHVNNPDVVRADYVRAIEQDNCLNKRSGATRALSARHLSNLYSLDPSVTLFRTLRYFWSRDIEGQPLLALLCAYARDPLLRLSASYILTLPEGSTLQQEELLAMYEEQFPGRFSKSTLHSVVRNLSSTWTKSGHLSGKVKKVRVKAQPTVGSVSYGLLLGYLSGARGEALFDTEFMKVLDCAPERALEFAAEASRRGWLVFKRIGKVMEVSFPKLLSDEEVGWTREQD